MGDTRKTDGTSKTGLMALVIVIAVVAGVLIWWLSHRSKPAEDCSFTGWKRTVGVELDAQVQDLNAVKGKLGISDSMIRDYDTLMKDYALKYDSACQDVRAGRMTQGEYACLRQNMSRTLDDIRTFNQAVEAAKSLSDPTAQKEVVQKAFGALEGASRTNYRLGCTSAMTVNPRTISFTGDALDSFVEITNNGNNDFTFAVDGLPAAFRPHPPSGKLSVSGTAAIVIERSFGPVPPAQPIKFLVRTNLNDEQEIAITVDSQNMDVWQRLGKKTRANANRPVITVDDALHVVSDSVSSRVPAPDKYVLASTLLLYMGQSVTAKAALAAATNEDPSLNSEPSALFLNGIIANRERQPQAALTYFARAKDSTAPTDKSAQSISDLASGIINFNLGKRDTADSYLKTYDLQKEVRGNPLLPYFGAQEFCAKGGCQAYVNQTFEGTWTPPKGGG
jgi:hypothetical protein